MITGLAVIMALTIGNAEVNRCSSNISRYGYTYPSSVEENRRVTFENDGIQTRVGYNICCFFIEQKITVREGDTIAELARKGSQELERVGVYGRMTCGDYVEKKPLELSPKDIMKQNSITDPRKLQIGTELRLRYAYHCSRIC